MVEGAEDGGCGAAALGGGGGGLGDGFEGGEGEGSMLEVGQFAVAGEPGGDVGPIGPLVKIEQVLGAGLAEVVPLVGGEFGGEGGVVLVEGEEADQKRAVLRGDGRKRG